MYMELGRIMRLTGGEIYSVIRVNWLTKIFVVGDVVAFLTQALGTSLRQISRQNIDQDY